MKKVWVLSAEVYEPEIHDEPVTPHELYFSSEDLALKYSGQILGIWVCEYWEKKYLTKDQALDILGAVQRGAYRDAVNGFNNHIAMCPHIDATIEVDFLNVMEDPDVGRYDVAPYVEDIQKDVHDTDV